MKSNPLKPHQVAIIAATLTSLVLWAVPGLHLLMLPLQYLNTHFHELSHALVATATGGHVSTINVYADGSGVTNISGGNWFLAASAGYIGAAIIGAIIMQVGRNEKSAKVTLRALAVVLAFVMILWVRGDLAGILSGFAWVAALFYASSYAKGPTILFVAQFIGIQQCLNAVHSLYELLQISALTERVSDAKILENQTHIPAMAWAVLWCLFSLALVTLGLRRAWSTAASPPSRPAESR
ncbi:M50 family metallopeptidase [Fimbriimonas ginsengisoli]|uniref:M50 family metallopeptidase n=1 Tax=Fimbriimonas ginsengisoli TaxID=1005039 RepID=UPI00046D065D|nr:M50 family metallopeptidase [Fimbriimonas ginsengisoli]